MDDKRFTLFTGGFGSYAPPRAKNLSQSISYIQEERPLNVKPGSSSHGFIEGPTTQFQYKKGNVWGQMVGESESGESTKYSNLVKKFSVEELTRANKALVKGGGDSLVHKSNAWHGKPYSGSAMTTASLLRLNETTTAFGSSGFNHTSTDVGTGIMAEVLNQKWSEKDSGTPHDSTRLLGTLESKYPQLKSVKAMHRQGQNALMSQVEESRMSAAIAAGNRGFNKGMQSWQVNEYVQRKFAKHGLGNVPGGWMEAVTGESSERREHTIDAMQLEEKTQVYSGSFHSYRPEQARTLQQGISLVEQERPFEIRPQSSSHGFMEGPTTQIQYTKSEVWGQQIGKSRSGESTKYRSLFEDLTVKGLIRANKALVHGGGDRKNSEENTWHGKSYTGSAMTTATLMRINETTTAFGRDGFQNAETDVGAGIMAEALHTKWSEKNAGKRHSASRLLGALETKFPQLKTVEDMREQGEHALKRQVAKSRMSAAVSAGERAYLKGHRDDDIGAYVQRKFEKHGLGALPEGWGEQLQKKRSK